MNIEKIIRTNTTYTETGYLDDDGYLITHSFDDEPAMIFTNGRNKSWYKDGLLHRDNNLPALIWFCGYSSFFKNGEHYWFIDGEEYYDINEIKEKFKNKILKLKNINMKILKDNGINAIDLYCVGYLILDQSQYNLAVLKFL